MKRGILFIIVIFFQTIFFAQQRFRAGVSFGPTVTEIAGIGSQMYHKPGLFTGLILNSELSKKWALQFEMNYVTKGSLQRPDSSNNGHFYVNIGYVEIPFLLKRHIHFNSNGKIMDRFDVEFGLLYGRRVGKINMKADNYPVTFSESSFNNDLVDFFGGVGFNFSSNFSFSLRYSNSLVPAVKRNALNLAFIRYTYNQGNNESFQFVFKYIFGSTADKIYVPEQPQKNGD